MTILQPKTSKTQITTNTGALIYLRLHGSVAERIKHELSSMLTKNVLSRKEFKSLERQILHYVAGQPKP